MKLAFTGGGTAGHAYPAISVIRALRTISNSCEFLYVGSGGIEKRLADAEGIPYVEIDVTGLPRSLGPAALRASAQAAVAVARVARAFRREGVAAVFAAGGFVSFPACAAAVALRLPLFLHEQNAVPGLVNRLFAGRSEIFFESLPTGGAGGRARRAVLAGNPVRPEIALVARMARERARAAFDLDPGRRTLLVFGGSGGARRLNLAVVDAVRAIDELPVAAEVQVLHALGRRDFAEFGARAGLEAERCARAVYRPVPYIDDMASAYAAADLVVCRAGATTIAELAVAGRPSILVPYPFATDDHQRKNARYFAGEGAAVLVDDAELSSETIVAAVATTLFDQVKLATLAANARRLARPDAAERIASSIMAALEPSTDGGGAPR